MLESKSDQVRYVLRHYAVRRILSSYIGCLPSEVTLIIEKYGKPQLANREYLAHFNSSHSKDFSVCALSATEPVDVDLEVLKPLDEIHSVSQVVLSQDELSCFNRLLPSAQTSVFFIKFGQERKPFLNVLVLV